MYNTGWGQRSYAYPNGRGPDTGGGEGEVEEEEVVVWGEGIRVEVMREAVSIREMFVPKILRKARNKVRL